MKMAKWLVAIAVSTIFSLVGWYAGAPIGPMTGYIFSTILGGVGLWYGAKWGRNLLG